MVFRLVRILLSAALLASASVITTAGRVKSQPAAREVAVTFDDLPAPYGDLEDMRRITSRLLDSVKRSGVPAIGFVNEGRLYRRGEMDARTDLLRAWLDAGFELGNHTFSHINLQRATLAEYVPYMERMMEFSESYAREVTGREIPQVLMLTAGALNADCFDDLAAMLKRRGYSFVTMEQATADEAYSLPDNYTGEHGDSWLARWAVTKGMRYRDTEEENLGPYMQSYFADFVKKQQAERSKGAGKK